MSTAMATADRPAARRYLQLGIIWALLLTVPLWLPLLGGYTAIAGRVLVFALAAMSFNMLLGFTGVMSFGHAAYFGLGAYGAGLFLKFVAASTPLAILAGTLLGGIAGTLFGLLLVRRRGVYFAMVTIAFGQVCFYIAYKWDDFTGGYDGLRGFTRAPLDLGFLTTRHREQRHPVLLFRAAGLRPGRRPASADPAASPFGRTLLAIRENERRARFLGLPVERHIWLSFSISCFFTALAGALRPAEQLRRPHGPELHHVRQYRDDHGDGRHAHLLGSAGRRSAVRDAAGLRLVDDDELDVLCRLPFVRVVLFFPRGLMGMLHGEGRLMHDVTPKLEVRQPRRTSAASRPCPEVSMRVEQGELRAMIGPNGAGKTTFFNLITGFFPPYVRGHPAGWPGHQRRPAAGRVKTGMGRTFQITEIFPELTVRENIRIAVETGLGLQPARLAHRADKQHVADASDEVMTLANLTCKADRLVGAAVARRSAVDGNRHGARRSSPSLLLLDEPTAGMGDEETYQITGLIRRLHRDLNYTIVLIEHDMRVVFHLADHISVLAEGRLLAEGTPAEIGANVARSERLSGKSGMNAIEVSGLNTFYGKSHILHDVSTGWPRKAASRRCWAATVPARPRRCAASWG